MKNIFAHLLVNVTSTPVGDALAKESGFFLGQKILVLL